MAQCSICIAEFTSSDSVYRTNCDHVFHLSCAQDSLERSPNCPLCRRNMTQLYKLYLSFESTEGRENGSTDLRAQLNKSNLKLAKLESLNLMYQTQRDEAENAFKIKLESLQKKLKDKEADLELNRRESQTQRDEAENAFKLKLESLQKQLQGKEAELELIRRGNQSLRDRDQNAFKLKLESIQKQLQGKESENKDLQRRFQDLQLEIEALKKENQSPSEISFDPKIKAIDDKLESMYHELKESITLLKREVSLEGITSELSPSRHSNNSVGQSASGAIPNEDSEKNVEEDSFARSIIIKGYIGGVSDDFIMAFILRVTKALNIICSSEDISYIAVLHTITTKSKLLVTFTTLKMKSNILALKHKLLKDETLKHLFLEGFSDRKTNIIFKYAKVLQNSGYKLVYHKNNEVFCKKEPYMQAIKINSREEVDNLRKLCNGTGN